MTFHATPQSGSRPPQRSRARRLLPVGIAVWLVLEIWLWTLVAHAAGGLTVLLLILAGIVLGGYVVKRAGRRAWRGLTGTFQGGGPTPKDASPGATADASSGGNALPMLGGLLLMFPGLISDVAGLLCLFPPTRSLIRRRAERALSRRTGFSPGSFAPGPFGEAFGRSGPRHPDDKVVPGEVVREDEPPAQRRQDPPLPR
ncbi:FxsA family membrane protein [Streptomyces sp. NPDC003077]|uniref:FxsA family membrane protein n=1 Tax=Streptomyces sp. NPDC003077 TaxID=3154443 RepID=UPI0033B5EA56